MIKSETDFEKNFGLKPKLISTYDLIKEKPDTEPRLSDLKPLLADSEYRKKSFEEVREAFIFEYDRDKIAECLSKNEPDEEDFRYLKKLRRLGVILRSNYNFFGQSHLSPEVFVNLISNLGRYNDNYWLGSAKREQSKIYSENVMTNGNIKQVLEIDYADNRNFTEYARGMIFEIKILLKDDVFGAQNFHDLRKKIRICADSLQYAASDNLDSGVHWLFSSMLELSTELGHIHDAVLQKSLRGEGDYHDSNVKIDPSVRERFMALMPYMEKVFGITD